MEFVGINAAQWDWFGCGLWARGHLRHNIHSQIHSLIHLFIQLFCSIAVQFKEDERAVELFGLFIWFMAGACLFWGVAAEERVKQGWWMKFVEKTNGMNSAAVDGRQAAYNPQTNQHTPCPLSLYSIKFHSHSIWFHKEES